MLPAPSGCSTACKGTVAANLQRFASALAEIQSKPLQPEPPSTAAAKQTTHREKRGDRGESTILHFNIHLPLSPLANSPLGSRGTRMPRRLCAARVDDPSTRESGSLRQNKPASQEKCLLTPKFVEPTNTDSHSLRRVQLYALLQCIAFKQRHMQTSIRQ